MPRSRIPRVPVPHWRDGCRPSATATLPDGRSFDFALRLRHWAYGGAFFPHDWEGVLYHGTTHHLDLVADEITIEIDGDHAARETGDDAGDFEDARWRALRAIPGVQEVVSPRADTSEDETLDRALLFARLTIIEIPEFARAACRESWYTTMDAHASELGEIVASIENDPPIDFSALLSTLFWFTRLDVHPAIRGRSFGATLISHALRLLIRDQGDVAIAEVMPCESRFVAQADNEREKADRSRAAQRRLARYYTRAGFQRWPRRHSAGSHPILWFAGEWHPDPADELDEPED